MISKEYLDEGGNVTLKVEFQHPYKVVRIAEGRKCFVLVTVNEIDWLVKTLQGIQQLLTHETGPDRP